MYLPLHHPLSLNFLSPSPPPPLSYFSTLLLLSHSTLLPLSHGTPPFCPSPTLSRPLSLSLSLLFYLSLSPSLYLSLAPVSLLDRELFVILPYSPIGLPVWSTVAQYSASSWMIVGLLSQERNSLTYSLQSIMCRGRSVMPPMRVWRSSSG